MMSDGARQQFGHVNLMPYGVNRTVISQAFRLNQCHHQHDFDSHHVSGIHHNFFLLLIPILIRFSMNTTTFTTIGIKVS